MSIFLILSLIFVLWLTYEIQKHNKIETKHKNNFWEHEYQANFARAKDISSLNYIIVPIDSLPFKNLKSKDFLDIQSSIQELSKKPLLNLSGKTNTDLKYQYGVKNLESLMEYDQNYLLFIRKLNEWAHLLYQNNFIQEAKTVLEYAVSLKTDIRTSYTLLADIYADEGNDTAMNSLLSKAKELNTLMKPSIIQYITILYQQHC